MVGYKWDWYRIVSRNEVQPVQQGDFIFNLDVPVASATERDEVPVKIDTFDAIILTQSCDINKAALQYIVLCPVWDIKDAAKIIRQFNTPGGKEELRQGRYVAFHMLNQCDLPGYQRGCMVVQFERVIVRPKDIVLELVASQEDHLRLLPPYREEMAQRFGMFFARVGLPVEIPKVKSK